MADIKLSTVIEVARAKRHTLPYILKAGPELVGVHAIAGRGNHRVFTPDQAYRLAVVAVLMDQGHEFLEARQVLTFAERKAKQTDNYFTTLARSGRTDPHFPDQPGQDLYLWLADHRYVAVHRLPEDSSSGQLQWYPLPPSSGVVTIDPPLAMLRVNLTRLRDAFLRHAMA
jgi:hypothetical protein